MRSFVILNLMKMAAEQYEAGGDAYHYAAYHSCSIDVSNNCTRRPCDLHAQQLFGTSCLSAEYSAPLAHRE